MEAGESDTWMQERVTRGGRRAEILVLDGVAILPAPVVAASTMIFTRLQCGPEHNSTVKLCGGVQPGRMPPCGCPYCERPAHGQNTALRTCCLLAVLPVLE